MPDFKKTVRAFLAEEGSTWGIVDAITEEMPDTSASAIGECQRYLSDHGIDRAAVTIKKYRIVGSFMQSGSSSQRRLFRSQSFSTVDYFSQSGKTPDATERAIRDYQARTGKKRMSDDAARGRTRPSSQGGSPTLSNTDPESWTDAQWARFDVEVIAATRTLLTAFECWQRGIYTPTALAAAQLSLVKPPNLDAELAALLDAGV